MSDKKPYTDDRWKGRPEDLVPTEQFDSRRTKADKDKDLDFVRQLEEAFNVKLEKGGKHGKQ
ncbi:hypothetical protein [Lacticaseibacillus saniviri]